MVSLASPPPRDLCAPALGRACRRSWIPERLLAVTHTIVRCLKPPDPSLQDAANAKIKKFAKDSLRLVQRCEKPDRKEFFDVAKKTAIGFLLTGIIGFIVKVVFIPGALLIMYEWVEDNVGRLTN